MIAAAPHYSTQSGDNRDFEYLLLGDLRQVLEEPSGPQTSRWLIAILDMILVGRPHSRQTVYLPVNSSDTVGYQRDRTTVSMMEKLRRLRDRVAHRTGHAELANELRDQLHEYMQMRIAAAIDCSS